MRLTATIALQALLCLTAAHAAPKAGRQKAVAVEALTANHMADPMSLATATPQFGWRITSTERDVRQTSRHILVASSPELLAEGKGDLWDSDEPSSESQWVSYAGKPLKSHTRAYWKVQVATSKGLTDWSTTATFNVGLLGECDWQGDWIGYDHAEASDLEDVHSRLAARYFRREFQLKEGKTVGRATLYICGLGLYEAWINGQRVSSDVLTPAPTDYRRTALYNAYDVTALLAPATPSSKKRKSAEAAAPAAQAHALAVAVGNGRFYTMQQHKKPYKITNFGYPKLRLNLVIDYTDGTRQTIATDTKWQMTTAGPIRSNNEYDGETYDARRQLGAWTRPGYAADPNSWHSPERVAAPYGTLRGMETEAMAVVDTIAPKSVTRTPRGLLLDFGQNIAGWLRLNIRDTRAGDTVTIRYAEIARADTLWRDNFRNALSTDTYIADGSEQGRSWQPAFTTHGFRYAEVSGLASATAADFTACAVSDRMEPTGHFACSDATLNQVYRNAVWGVLANYKGMPVDCPQRDERMPWLGDRARGCFGESFLFDCRNLYAKWTRDIAEAQREDGCIPDVAPAYWNYYSDNITWPAALPFTLEMLYRQFGDRETLAKYYPAARRWLDHMAANYKRDGLMPRDKYGDWCVPPEKPEMIHSQDPARRTDGTLIASATYYRLCRLMQEFADTLGLPTDADAYGKEADEVREAFNRKFLTVRPGTSEVPGSILHPDSTYYGNNTVTANILPLAFGMVPEGDIRREVEKNVIRAIITTNSGHISTGVIGTQWLMHALTAMGRTDIAYLLATQKTYPSWGYMAQHGATTTWELWNGDTASPKMNSGNHVMLLGDLLSWLYEDVAGIRAAAPGFRRIELAPAYATDGIDCAEASYRSPYGRIVSRWAKERGRLKWHVEIPANTTASLHMPDGQTLERGSGAYDIDEPLPLRDRRIVCDEFLYNSASFPECHSASIAETRKGTLIATYFGGTKERNPDVCIWVSRKPRGAKEWTKPQMVADGVLADTLRKACWNPVVYELPDGRLSIYFKIGSSVADWTGWQTTSKDDGRSWAPRRQMPDSLLGAVRNKPVRLPSGRIIAPCSLEKGGWRLYFEYSDDGGLTWSRTEDVEPRGKDIQAIQPTILFMPDGSLKALCRTRSRHIAETTSRDGGLTWTPLRLTATPNNNSGIDAVTMADGRHALICNYMPIETYKQKGARTPLGVLFSTDAASWGDLLTLEDSPVSQYSYPSIIQTRDGHLHAIYTWRRQRIKHVEINPTK